MELVYKEVSFLCMDTEHLITGTTEQYSLLNVTWCYYLIKLRFFKHFRVSRQMIKIQPFRSSSVKLKFSQQGWHHSQQKHAGEVVFNNIACFTGKGVQHTKQENFENTSCGQFWKCFAGVASQYNSTSRSFL